MKRICILLLAFLLVLPCQVFSEGSASGSAGAGPVNVPAENSGSAGAGPVNVPAENSGSAELISAPLPINFTGGTQLSDAMFNGDTSYRDPTIQVDITYRETSEYSTLSGRDTGYWVADIRIGDASQLRTAAAESFSTNTSLPPDRIAERVRAVLAINGDFVTRLNDGLVIRQGTVYRNKLKGMRDVLLIDEDGDFHVVHLPDKGQVSDSIDGKRVINAFYFGPVLVENGAVVEKLPSFTYLEPDKNYARIAICQVGHLHYKVIVTTMEQDYKLGLKLKDFADLCAKEGAQIAYNLDGGMSTTLYFNHKRLNEQKRVAFRNIPDIIYFASAWNGDNA